MDSDAPHDPHEDGMVATVATRYVAFALGVATAFLLVSPPYSFKPILPGIAATAGLFCLARQFMFPNMWLCWMLYVIAFLQLSELRMPIASHGFPADFWGRLSFFVAIPCALLSFVYFIVKFVLRCVRDIRERRPISFDD
ncbi:membrane protein [Rhodopirellula sp. SWK7]|nr:membrane protein [Rhodopirellula sp. SWK7]